VLRLLLHAGPASSLSYSSIIIHPIVPTSYTKTKMKPTRVMFLQTATTISLYLQSKHVLTHAFTVGAFAAFSPPRNHVSSCRVLRQGQTKQTKEMLAGQLLFSHKIEDAAFEDSQREEIRHLIVTLSQEKNDETRRSQLNSLLNGKVASGNPTEAYRFLNAWDKILIEIGSLVQNQARENFLAHNETTAAKESMDGAAAFNSGMDQGSEREKSDIELQVWALIDMMVQSKAFIKKRFKVK
jgi:hypothetical protein